MALKAILVAVDGSENSDRAVRHALDLVAAGLGSELHFLNVQPNRVRIVRTDRRMTLAEFNQRYPSVISIADLAIINQVEGASTSIPAGTPVKRVVAS